jgi:methionyl-tRNA formyltransferase
MKIGFFGTPEFARDILRDLVSTPGIEVVFAVTKPDAPVGRSAELRASSVKSFALEAGIPVFAPEKIRANTELFKALSGYGAEYFVVAAYGKILPNEILEMPSRLCVNVHGSILPKYRGASPIQSALVSGETVTGVTVMAMSEGMDEGDILSVLEIPIERFETAATLF